MESGIVDQERLAQLLQNISQRRRSGVLELLLAEGPASIFFHLGKIVDFIPPGLSDGVEVLRRRLVAAQLLPDTAAFKTVKYPEFQQKLQAASLGERVTEAEFLSFAVQQTILDGLYSLNIVHNIHYSFRAQMLDPNEYPAHPISVGQLLLDYVSLEATRDRFASLFSEGQLVRQAKEGSPSFSENEEILFDLLAGKGEVEPAELRSYSLLSSYHFEEALLGLYDQGFVVAVPRKKRATAPTPVEELPSLEAAAAALDAAIESEEKELEEQQTVLAAAGAIPEEAQPTGDSELEAAAVLEEPAAVGLPWQVRLKLLNSQLLQREWAPRLVALLFFVLALFAPFLFWQSVFSIFSE